MLNTPLANRYKNDGINTVPLTELQLRARNKIQEKIKNGLYPIEDVSCPLCNSTSKYLLSEKDAYGLPSNVVLCQDCNLVYAGTRLTEKALRDLYGSEYRELDRVLPGIEDYFQLEKNKGAAIYKFLADNNLLKRLKGKLIIEVGCGAGGVLSYFKEQGFEVLGCDYVPKHLKYSIEKYGLDLHYGGLEEIRKIIGGSDRNVGLVIYEQVFEHLPFPKKELISLHSLMSNKSLLYLGVPGLRLIDVNYESDFLKFLQMPHLLYFDLERLNCMLATSGFSRILGDEKIMAVFETVPFNNIKPKFDNRDTLKFLMAMEKQRRPKAVLNFIKRSPKLMGLSLQAWILRSPLPASLKKFIANSLKKIYRIFSD